MGIGYNPKIVTNGLVLCLDAANRKSYPGSGTTWFDLSGRGNNGTLTNGPTFNSGNGGNFSFDGTNDYVVLSRPSSITNGISITISLWAKWTTTGTTVSTIQTLIDNNHTTNRGFVIQDRPDLNGHLTWSSQVSAIGAESTIVVGDGKWHHIVGTNDTVTSKLYIDGILNAQANESAMLNVQPNISIGYWQTSPGRYLLGNIPQVQIYTRALSASEIQQNFNATRGRYGI